jgi:inositol polyphosphate 5-phosphatase INPP5B/F
MQQPPHVTTPQGSVVSEDDDQQQQQQQADDRIGPTTNNNDESSSDVLIPSLPDEETETGMIRNADAIAKIRDTWIYKQVRLRQDEFTNYTAATFFVGTWNVNAKTVGKSDGYNDDDDRLHEWLLADWRKSGNGPPDIVAVGFQEIVDLNAANVVVDNKTQQKSQFWCERLHQTLNNNNFVNGNSGYTLLAQKSMVGLLICVFVKTQHKPRVKYLSATSVGVGVMGMMGNKGGVSIRLQFYDSTLCFVCSHLAAHRENVVGRNADFQNVYSKTSFEIGEEAIREVIRSGSLSHWAIGSSSVGIPDHDIVFWLGDLNYRIDESLSTETVLKLAEKNGGIAQLEPLDQLNMERAAGRVLRNFQEGRLTFAPTYKYQPGTHMYDQRPEKKIRAPAWCDRILWSAQEAKHVQQLTYNRSEMPNISDHKPVYSTLRVTIKDVIQAKREAIYDELMRKLDRYENKSLPIVGLDRVSLDFGEIRYGQRLSLPIQITNRGIVVAQFRLVPKLDEVFLLLDMHTCVHSFCRALLFSVICIGFFFCTHALFLLVSFFFLRQ